MVAAMGARLLLATLASLLTSCAWFRPDPPEYEPLRRASGLVLQDLVVPDEGPEVLAGDTVALQYELWLADLTHLETSRKTGHPLRFVVGDGSVPAGIEQGVLGMRLFGRRRLSVPSALGFGGTGRPPRIPPDADLVFEIELIEHAPGAH
jgi:FKBP-type peptidyl-prolyl cis-trans isomerase